MSDSLNQVSQAIGQLQAGQTDNRHRADLFEKEMKNAARDMMTEVKAIRHDLNNKLMLVNSRLEKVEQKHLVIEGVAKRMALIWGAAGTLGGAAVTAILQLAYAKFK